MTERSQDGRVIVRVFPDYAGTVLWSGGAVDYEEAHLSQELEGDLQAWESFHRSRLDPDRPTHTTQDAYDFAVTGRALAGQLSEELGRGVEVHLIVEGRQVFRSTEAPLNPRAAKAFHARAERQAAEARALIEKVDGGRWYAYNPVSGSRFYPGPARSDDNARAHP
ncbi:hypothetical protein [Frigoribacterium sp. VKM Ac-2836]|uniref:hypothetical protein n=1 Tax=Frigoribacterium sp. VKM Ac-2836 TaxID=2739014 RepID=UPI0015671073|nr:hypothetical protein [Frigoribacterium sp. VKM Ac-2836]NRD27983.1 hypothetical protein [Frigoribacterium sp. VKM Ac-2836]